MSLSGEVTAKPRTKAPRVWVPRHVFDRRTKAARRFARLVTDFTAELGGNLSEARLAIVRQLAGVTIQCEELQAAVVRGEEIDTEQHVRLVNVQARLTHQLGLDRTDRKPGPRTLADKLAEHEAAA